MNAITQSLFDFSSATPVVPSRPLIVDSFAGGGGASTGIELALGRSPDIAINHSAEALALHAANHPDTLHLSKNIWKVDPLEAVGNRRVGLAWFSPDCKHFSVAKGGKPVKRNIRDLAWVVVGWAKRARPEVIVVENVEEFEGWGPLVEGKPDNWYPCPDRVGETFKRWVGDLKRLGYRVDWKLLKACDFGAPTIRERLFVIARRDGLPIVWPTPTHGPGRAHPWRTAADVIDWTLPCPSIFDTSEEIFAKHGVRAVRPLAENTLARIAKGLQRYVLDPADPFIVEGAARSLISYYSEKGESENARANSVDEPLRTITTANRHAVVAAYLVKYYGAGAGVDVAEPLHTVTTRDRFGLVYAFLTPFYSCGLGQEADAPLRTLTTKEKFGVVTVNVAGKPYAIVDIGLRMLTPRELYSAQGFPADYRIDAGADGKPFTRKTQVACVGNSVSPPVAAAIVRADGKPFTRKTQVACVGNSVSPPVAAAIVRANCSHLSETLLLEAA